MKPPTAESYWVVDGKVLAGKYPGAKRDAEARAKIEALLSAGIRTFVDLTDDGELLPYATLLPPDAAHHRIAFVDVTCPSMEQVTRALDLIEEGAERGAVYVHCRGGCGRTGVVIGCYLAEQGLDPEAALERVHELTRRLWSKPCPETPEQVALIRDWRRSPTLVDRVRGCLLGGAVGDALGAPVEFLRSDQIRRRFGRAGITEFAPAYGRRGAVTDDTQMTLFTAEGLLRADNRGRAKGICDPPSIVWNAYQRWLHTQGEKVDASLLDGWLVGLDALASRRAPGTTCLSALGGGMMPQTQHAANDSKGCGGVMRAAPAGILVYGRPFDAGSAIAALTHGHPSGYLSAGYFAAVIDLVLDGQSLAEAAEVALRELQTQRDSDECASAVRAAITAAQSGDPDGRAIASLGEGWVAEEALAISLYCALLATTFEEGVRLAVNHDGDSDSTGSIAGNLLGAEQGVGAIPDRWLAELELRDVITEIADDLARHREGRDVLGPDEFEPKDWAKYPGW